MGKRLTDGIGGALFVIVIVVLSVGAYARNSFWKDEIGLWTDCVKKAPRKERTHHNLGYAYYEKGCLEEAKRELGEALALNPDYTLSWYNLGLVYYQEGMTEEAIDCYEKALDLDSPPPETHYNLGLAYHRKGLYSEALEAFQAFLEVRPDYRNGYNNLGLAYQRLGRWDEAAESFQEELRRSPENPYAYLYLGDLYHERKDDPRALVYYRKALACPGFPEAAKIEKTVSSIERSLKKG